MQENFIEVFKSARYVTLGQPSDKLRQVFYLFHGYGQLAPSFIEGFYNLANVSRYFIAPEGLSRFYLSGLSGKVGASWMTSEGREYEITDYLHYLDKLYKKVHEELPDIPYESIIFGFSQGVATACRWLAQLKVCADKLIIWAGTMPSELDLWQIKAHYPELEVYLVAGTQDPLVNSDIIQEQENRLEKAAINYRKIRFEGKHVIDFQTLNKII